MLGGTPSPRFPQEHLTGRLTVNLGTVLCAECYMGQSLSTREEAVDRFIEMCVWEKASYSVHAAAKSLQLGPTLCDPIDGSPQGSPIPGILQARSLEWVAISFSSAWKWKVKMKSLSLVRLLATPWTAAHQAPPSRRFSRRECWSGVPLPSPYSVHRGRLIESKHTCGRNLGLYFWEKNVYSYILKKESQSYFCVFISEYMIYILMQNWKSEKNRLPLWSCG